MAFSQDIEDRHTALRSIKRKIAKLRTARRTGLERHVTITVTPVSDTPLDTLLAGLLQEEVAEAMAEIAAQVESKLIHRRKRKAEDLKRLVDTELEAE